MRPYRLTAAALLCLSAPASASQCAFTEVMYNPPAGKPEFIEVVNLTSNRLDMAKWKLTGGVDYTFPDFNPGATAAHFFNEYERIVLSSATEAATRTAYPNLPPNVRVFGPWTGSLDNAGEAITLLDYANALQASLSYGDRGNWPRSADGAGHSLQIINQDRKMDDWRNWRASKARGGSPGFVEPASAEDPANSPEVGIGTTTIVTQFNDVAGTGSPSVPAPANPGDTQWRFYNAVAAPPSNWMQPTFVDTAWSGPGHAPLGFENAAAPFIGIRTQVAQTSNLFSYYFRTTFNWTGPLTGNSFAIDQVLDDGAIYYINGQEVGRDRMPNPEGHGNAADPTAVGDATLEPGKVSGGPSILDGKLVSGVNTIAASVHQNGGTSSDHVFAARLKITTAGPPGPVINEVQPGTAGNGFVEFYNPTGAPVDLQNYYLSDLPGNLTKFQITTSLVIPSLGYATVGYTESNLGLTSPVVVILTQPDGITRQAYISSTMTIDGRSLGRKPAGGGNWFFFTGPTPGADNFSIGGGDSSPLRLSEAHFGAGGNVDWVELQNISNGLVPVGAVYVSSLPDLSDRVAFSGSLAAGTYGSATVNFPTDGSGDITLYLSDASNTVLGTAEIERRSGLPSVQAWPAGANEWYASATDTDTRDLLNNPARSTEIVINEIMYDLPSKHTNGEFIELLNRSGGDVLLTGWRLTKGLDYAFPPGTMIASGEHIVVAVDPAFITATYGGGVRVFGPAQGTLGNKGDLIRLEDANQNLADGVDYKDGGNWPAGAAGAGSSLELLHPDMDNSQPSSWRASNESAKSTFQPFTFTGIYRQLRGAPTVDTAYKELLMNLVSDGHIVLRNVSLTRAAAPATNVIPGLGGTVTSHGSGTGTSGWLCLGTHSQSDTLADGFHLISQGSGDTKANKVEVDVLAIQANDTLTFSCEARWISGLPLLVVQTWDRSFGKVLRLAIPNNLGTPGAANTAVVAAAPPTVDRILHAPPVPTSSQAVVVTARVSSATALASVSLIERIESVAAAEGVNGALTNGPWNSTPMNDSGTGADVTAGDGIWSASVSARADRTITQFYVRATAANGQSNECPRMATGVAAVNGSIIGVQERSASWIVSNAVVSTAPGTLIQRFILSQYARNSMLYAGVGFAAAYDFDHPRMSNFGWNATLIFNERDIQYNGELRRGGSPWTRSSNDGAPANRLSRARWKSPGDDLFRNRSKSGTDNDAAGGSRFHNRMARYMMYLFAYPSPDSEFIQQIVNSDSPRLADDQEQTDADFFGRAYGDGGELFEIDDAWFMYDTNNHDDRIGADSVTGRWSLLDWNNSTAASPSDESPIFFHGNWPIRFPEDRYDYAALSSMIKTAFNNNTALTLSGVSVAVDDVLTRSQHSLTAGEGVSITTISGAAPLVNGGSYYAIPLGLNTFKLATTPANALASIAIDITGAGSLTLLTDDAIRFPGFRGQMERQIDGERSAIYAAVRGYIGDWDNFTLNRGKNGYYFRRPTDGLFEFHHWDSDLAFQNTGEGWLGTTGGTGWTNYTSRPWWRTRFNYYLTELITKYTGGSARMTAALTAMNYQSANGNGLAPFKTSGFSYPGWFTGRDPSGLNFVGAANHNRVFAVATADGQTVATPAFTLNGEASSRTARVDVVGHPEAVFAWSPNAANLGSWTISNVRLVAGPNVLSIRALASDGSVLNTIVRNVTLSVNAPPVVTMTADPASNRVAVNEEIVFDATTSFDPEGTPLSFVWTVTPATGVTVAHSVPGKTEARFSIPGIYSVSVTATDGAANNTIAAQEITVFNANDFAPFAGGAPLGPQFTVLNVEVRDNFSASSWYSVEDSTGRLHIQVLDDSAKPLASPAFTHPLITRDLPDTSDFIIQTDLEPDTREMGNWQSGLFLEMIEGGTAVRYALSLDGGLNVVVRRAVQPAAWSQSATNPVTGSGATLRVRRSGDSLIFQRLNGTVWTTVHTQAIPAGSVAGSGGVFVSTSTATTVRVSFDYLLISNPAATDSVRASLRVTEIMYNPDGPGGVEFIELTNTGALPIQLAGVYFEDGRPFAQFTFPAYSLLPGAFVIVTNTTPALFSADYPATPPGSIFQWSAGNLNNGGERVTLRDSFGNIIQDFTYDDDPLTDWPQGADGGGYSLEIISTTGDYDSGLNWLGGVETGGSPGWLGAGPDTDGDSYSDRLELLAGTSATDGGNFFNAASTILPGGHKVTWPSYPGRTYHIETCPDLVSSNWTRRGTVIHLTGNPAGIGEFTVTNPAPDNALRTFYRVLVELTP